MTGKPLPTQLKVFRGTAQKCRTNPLEPKPKTDNIIMPGHLSPQAVAQWKNIVELLKSCGVMTNVDVILLGVLCEAYAKWIEANEKLNKTGLVIKNKDGTPVQSPYLAISNRALDQVRSLCIEFGMSPSSRSRIVTQPMPIQNEFDDF